MISPEFLNQCIDLATQQGSEGSPTSSTTTAVGEPDIAKDVLETLPHSPQGSESYSDVFSPPSNPVSIYHTGDPWPRPIDPEAQRVPMEARPIFKHPIALVWRELGRQVYEYLDSIAVKWTTIDPVRFAEAGKKDGTPFLWVGVMPGTLSRDDAEVAAVGCKDILAQSQTTDIEIAFRESIFTRFAGGPRLIDYVPSTDPAVDLCGPFTPALGLQIAPKSAPHFEGTGGLYLCEGGESDRIFLLTARHVVLPPHAHRNEVYNHKNSSQPRCRVILLGNKAYHNVLESIMRNIGHQTLLANTNKAELGRLGRAVEGEDAAKIVTREKLELQINEREELIETLNEFHGTITKSWSTPHQRILGHVAYAPRISVGTGLKHHTEDWALVELYRDKIDWKGFKGNVLRLGMFQSVSLSSSSLTIISRKQIFGR